MKIKEKMAFEDRFAITSVKLNNPKQRISFSIDQFDNIITVLLLVPNLEEKEHDHFYFEDTKDLKVFLNMLHMKGSHFLNLGYYRFEVNHSNKNESLVELKVNMFKSNDKKEGLDYLYSIHLSRENLIEIKEWIEIFLNTSEEKLKNRYQESLDKKS